jgi:hypothetical protein
MCQIDTQEVRSLKAWEAGKNASAYIRTWHLRDFVLLDMDDETGKYPYPDDRWVAMACLAGDGRPGRDFNKQLIDLGNTIIEDLKNMSLIRISRGDKMPGQLSLNPGEGRSRRKAGWLLWK